MIKRFQRAVSVVVMAFFTAASMFCCCLTKQAQAGQQVQEQLPPCHQRAAQSKTGSNSQSKDCNCLITKKLVADSNLKVLFAPTQYESSFPAASSILTVFKPAQKTAAEINTGPPFLEGEPLALYILHSNLRI